MFGEMEWLGASMAQETNKSEWPQFLKASPELGAILIFSTFERIEGVTQGGLKMHL